MSKKQIVMLMTDTTALRMVGCYGNADMQTPNIDRLASSGLKFEKAYTTTPVCGPARAALFTGQYAHTNGAWSNSMCIAANVKHLGQRLSEAGVCAGYTGKWHVDGSDYFGLGKCPEGWDPKIWYDMRNYLEELSPEDRQRSRRESLRKEGLDSSFLFGHRVTERALQFIADNASRDFVLIISYDEPHGPSLCPEPYASRHTHWRSNSKNTQDSLAKKPEFQKLWAGNKLDQATPPVGDHAALLACNEWIDSEIGRVLDKIDASIPDAMVIYTSDHGDFLDSHRLSGKGGAMYEEITHIPLIIRWPGHTKPNTSYSFPVSQIDLVPTILNTCGIQPSGVLEGRSLLPALENTSHRVNEQIFMEFHRYEIDHDGFGGFMPIRAAFDGRHKLSINLLDIDELYDLENDPDELNNLIQDPSSQAIRNHLHDKLLNWMNSTRDPFRGRQWAQREWRKDLPKPDYHLGGWTRQRLTEGNEPAQLDYDTGLEPQALHRKKKT